MGQNQEIAKTASITDGYIATRNVLKPTPFTKQEKWPGYGKQMFILVMDALLQAMF